jgi:tRNA1(Val) A37 N6-methylase TrmN6
MMLLEAAQGSRSGLKIMPPLCIYQEDGSYSREIEKMYNNEEKN